MTYYDILGVPQTATQDQIKQAYRLQVRFFHPDLFDGPPEVADIKTKQLNEAYSVLGNPELRSQYDRIVKANTQAPPKPNQEYQAHTKTETKSSDFDETYAAYVRTRKAEEEKQQKKKKRRSFFISIIAIVLAVDFIGGLITGNIKLWDAPAAEETKPATSYTDVNVEVSEPVLPEPEPEPVPPERILPNPIARPASGTILSGEECFDGSEITVTADSSSSYVVSLKTVSGTERVTFFVRAGETVTVGVPAEHLYVYFACGKTWYGYSKGRMFGTDTVYSKDDELLDFTEYTWQYELYPVTNGNFSETPSNADEFF